MKTLYVSDVDGTIYRAGQEELRESSRALFEQILSRGTLLTVASGRNLHGVFDLVEQAGITLPVIAYNGAVIYDFVQGEGCRQSFIYNAVRYQIVYRRRTVLLYL